MTLCDEYARQRVAGMADESAHHAVVDNDNLFLVALAEALKFDDLVEQRDDRLSGGGVSRIASARGHVSLFLAAECNSAPISATSPICWAQLGTFRIRSLVFFPPLSTTEDAQKRCESRCRQSTLGFLFNEVVGALERVLRTEDPGV
jgi:hypothetical protein